MLVLCFHELKLQDFQYGSVVIVKRRELLIKKMDISRNLPVLLLRNLILKYILRISPCIIKNTDRSLIKCKVSNQEAERKFFLRQLI